MTRSITLLHFEIRHLPYSCYCCLLPTVSVASMDCTNGGIYMELEELIIIQTIKELADRETRELLEDILLEMQEAY